MTSTLEMQYGKTTGLFVTKMASKETVVLGGMGERDKWTRVLTYRSAHALWFHLTRLFFPEKARMVAAIAATAPLRSPDKPTITTDVQVSVNDEGMIKLSGSTDKQKWSALLRVQDAHRLWQALDKALYPFGWEGATVNGSVFH